MNEAPVSPEIGAFPLSQSTHWYVAPEAFDVKVGRFCVMDTSTVLTVNVVTIVLSQPPALCNVLV